MRCAAKIDANQPEIVLALRQAGASVQPLHGVGGGCPDILAGWQGQNFLIEIKDGSKPPSARKLTTDQVRWHDIWQGQKAIVTNIPEALEAIGIKWRGSIE